MNMDVLKGSWKQIVGEAKIRWGRLTDDDFTEIAGEEEKFIGQLQKSYGYNRDEAEMEYRKFLASLGTTDDEVKKG